MTENCSEGVPKWDSEGTDDLAHLKDKYTIVKQLDEGAGGIIEVVQLSGTTELFAVKTATKLKNIANRSKYEFYTTNEYETMKKSANKKRVVQVYELVRSDTHSGDDPVPFQPLAIVMDLYKYGDLLHLLTKIRKRGLKTSDNYVDRVFAQTFDAVKWVHSKNVAHRDIKPENFMIDDQGNPLLADFGYAVDLDRLEEYKIDEEFLFMGTQSFKAPELYEFQEHAPTTPIDYCALDVWSLGVLYYQLLTSSKPWLKAHSSDHGYKSYAIQYQQTELHTLDGFSVRRHLSGTTFAQFKNDSSLATMVQMINPDPKKRPKLRQVSVTDWIVQARALPPNEETLRLVK